jgi:hypothetical protein
MTRAYNLEKAENVERTQIKLMILISVRLMFVFGFI